MEQKRYEFILEAQQPICHSEGTIGNESFLMRTEVRQPDGRFAHVPIISGDTMRHKLREASTYALLDAAGLLGSTLSEEALRLLFAGGMITGSDGGAVKLDIYRELCELIPPLALFGGCAQNRCIPGRMQVSEALLIADETMHVLPGWVAEYISTVGATTAPARKHVESVQRVRMDPVLDPQKRALLTEVAQVAVNERLRLSEKASEEADDAERLREKSTNMPRRFERVKTGSLFYWTIGATLMSDLDADTFNTTVMAFLSNAVVGGKVGTGHGRIRAITARQISLTRPRDAANDLDVASLSPRVGELFRRHVADRADRLREFLLKVDA
jgi:CRISPR type IV-associated protein Csf2